MALLLAVAIAGFEFVLCRLSLTLADYGNSSASVLLATGFAIAVLVRWRKRFALPLFAGAWLANALATNAWIGIPLSVANLAEAAVGAWLYRTVILQFRRQLEVHSQTVATLIASASGAFVSAVIGMTTLGLWGRISWGDTPGAWLMWFVGNTVGGMIMLPLTLNAARLGRWRSLLSPWAAIYLTTVVFASNLVFGTDAGDEFAIALFAVLIPVFATEDRLVPRLAVLLIACTVIWETTFGWGPFVAGSILYRASGLQIYLASLALSGMAMDAFVRRRLLRIVTPILLVGFAASAMFFYVFSALNHRRDDQRMDQLVNDYEARLHEKQTVYEELLRDASVSLSSRADQSDRKIWKTFTERLRIRQRLPGATGIGIVERVPSGQMTAFLARERKVWGERFAIHLPEGLDQSDSSEAWVVNRIEPLDWNLAALGLDLSPEPLRRRALELSRDTGSIHVAFVPHLLIGREKRAGFVYYHPIYNRDLSAEARPDERQAALYGWVFVPVQAWELFEQTLPPSPEIEYGFYEGDPRGDGKLIYKTENFIRAAALNHHLLERVRPVKIGGQDFFIRWRSSSGFVRAEDGLLSPLGGLGSLLTLALAWMFANSVTFRARAERLVAIQTRQIEEDHKRLMETQKMATLGEMASGIAHEINSPLTILLGRLNTLRDQIGKDISPEKLKETIDKLEKPAHRIGKIVGGLRSYMRKGDSDPMEPVLVRSIVEDTLELCTERFRKAEVRLEVEGDGLEQWISCRATQISQVLLNLIGNA